MMVRGLMDQILKFKVSCFIVWCEVCDKGQPEGDLVTGLECGQGRFLDRF